MLEKIEEDFDEDFEGGLDGGWETVPQEMGDSLRDG